MTLVKTLASAGSVASSSCCWKKGNESESSRFHRGERTYHINVFVFFLFLLRNDDLKVLPNVLLEFPNVHPLSSLGIVDILRSDSSCLSGSSSQEILFTGFDDGRRTTVTIIYVIESRSIVKVVVEELSVEGNCSTTLGCERSVRKENRAVS